MQSAFSPPKYSIRKMVLMRKTAVGSERMISSIPMHDRNLVVGVVGGRGGESRREKQCSSDSGSSTYHEPIMYRR
jgi:hypothetical protein